MIKFGTGGWRTKIGEDFIKSNIVKIAQGLANLMKDEGVQGIVIGYDRRFLSEEGAKWMAEVFGANGITTQLINNIAPTPLIMYTVNAMETSYGVAITASHNPASYNGIKIFTKGGKDASEAVTNKVEEYVNRLEEEHVCTMEYEVGVANGIIKEINPLNAYIDAILKDLDVEAIRNRHLRVLLDPMYGVSKTSLQTILLTARCEVDLIHERHDTLFGGRLPSPSAETLSSLKQKVVEKGYDIGLGTDGDADRLGVVDEKGNFIHPNEILVLIYYYLLDFKGIKGPVVRNLATTHLLDAIAKDYGQTCYEVPVGFKHISSKMEESGAILGGESSGGLTIAGHIKGKDGIFAASVLIEMIAVTGKSLNEMLTYIYEKYGTFNMVERGYSFKAEAKKKLMTTFYDKQELPSFTREIDNINTMDGIKVNFKGGGWVVIRFSGTEPLLRVFSEMPSKEEAEEICNDVKKFIESTTTE